MRHGYHTYSAHFDVSLVAASTPSFRQISVSRLLKIERYRGLCAKDFHTHSYDVAIRSCLRASRLDSGSTKHALPTQCRHRPRSQPSPVHRKSESRSPLQSRLFSQQAGLHLPKLPPRSRSPQEQPRKSPIRSSAAAPTSVASAPVKKIQGGSMPRETPEQTRLRELAETQERREADEERRLKRAASMLKINSLKEKIAHRVGEIRQLIALAEASSDAIWVSHRRSVFGQADKMLLKAVAEHKASEREFYEVRSSIEEQRRRFEEQRRQLEEREDKWFEQWLQLNRDIGQAMNDYRAIKWTSGVGHHEAQKALLGRPRGLNVKPAGLRGSTGELVDTLKKELREVSLSWADTCLRDGGEAVPVGAQSRGAASEPTSHNLKQDLFSLYWSHTYFTTATRDIDSALHEYRTYNLAHRLVCQVPKIFLRLVWFSSVLGLMERIEGGFSIMRSEATALGEDVARWRDHQAKACYRALGFYTIRAEQSAERNVDELQLHFDQGLSFVGRHPPTYIQNLQAGLHRDFARLLLEHKRFKIELGRQATIWFQGEARQQRFEYAVEEYSGKRFAMDDIRWHGYQLLAYRSLWVLWDRRNELIDRFGNLENLLSTPIDVAAHTRPIDIHAQEVVDMPAALPISTPSRESREWQRRKNLRPGDSTAIPVHYIVTREQAAQAAQELSSHAVLGVDIVSAPPAVTLEIFQGYRPIQYLVIASPQQISVIHLSMYRFPHWQEQVPPGILRILTDPSILKVGTDLERKRREMSVELGVSTESWLDVAIGRGGLSLQPVPGNINVFSDDSFRNWPAVEDLEQHFWIAASGAYAALDAYHLSGASKFLVESQELPTMSTAGLGPLIVDEYWTRYTEPSTSTEISRRHLYFPRHRGQYLLRATETMAWELISARAFPRPATRQRRLFIQKRIQAYYLVTLFDEDHDEIARQLFRDYDNKKVAMYTGVLWVANELKMSIGDASRKQFQQAIKKYHSGGREPLDFGQTDITNDTLKTTQRPVKNLPVIAADVVRANKPASTARSASPGLIRKTPTSARDSEIGPGARHVELGNVHSSSPFVKSADTSVKTRSGRVSVTKGQKGVKQLSNRPLSKNQRGSQRKAIVSKSPPRDHSDVPPSEKKDKTSPRASERRQKEPKKKIPASMARPARTIKLDEKQEDDTPAVKPQTPTKQKTEVPPSKETLSVTGRAIRQRRQRARKAERKLKEQEQEGKQDATQGKTRPV